MLSLENIREADQIVDPFIRRTPVEPSPALAKVTGGDMQLKLEALQVTGSFKVRGGLVALHRNAADSLVATCSAGNHGIGLSWAAAKSGRRVRVYVPDSVDPYKARALRSLGAEVITSRFSGFDDTEEWAIDECLRLGIPFMSAYDDPDVIAGNGGTLGLEILEAVPDLGTIVVPVGGGGMAAGLASTMSHLRPDVRLVACQLAACPSLALSMERGEAVTRMPATDTVAGGLEGGLGATPFGMLRDAVDQIVLVQEAQIAEAMRWMLSEHHYLVEPSCAVAVAACLSGEATCSGPSVVVLSGRNVSLATLQSVLI